MFQRNQEEKFNLQSLKVDIKSINYFGIQLSFPIHMYIGIHSCQLTHKNSDFHDRERKKERIDAPDIVNDDNLLFFGTRFSSILFSVRFFFSPLVLAVAPHERNENIKLLIIILVLREFLYLEIE